MQSSSGYGTLASPAKVASSMLSRLFVAAALVSLARVAQTPGMAAAASDSDVELLLAFKSSFTNGATVLSHWDTSTSPCSWSKQRDTGKWNEVTCDSAGSIKGIYVNDTGLGGTIPDGGWELPSSLEFFEVSGNRLTGTIPPDLKLPPGLLHLGMNRNRLTGTIPNSWALPKTLQLLALSIQPLSGTIPLRVLPPALTMLFLDTCQLTGTIPTEWGDASNLGLVTLWSNKLSGTLPSWPGKDNLQMIVDGFRSTRDTFFCGEVPSSPLYYERLETFEEVPLKALPSCSLAQDAKLLLTFRGSFINGDSVLDWQGINPCQWEGVECDGPPLQVARIALSEAGLAGTIPAGGWTLPDTLAALDLGKNGINGSLPAQWYLPQTLEILQLGHNQLTGTLPNSWYLPVKLKSIDLSNQQLSGTIPPNWATPPNLKSVSLINNTLSGSLPSSFLAQTEIFIKPGNTGLCGEVPTTGGSFKVLDEEQDPGVSSLPPCASTDPNQSSRSGPSTGVIVGAVVGAVCAVLVVALGCLFWVRWRRAARRGLQDSKVENCIEEGAEGKGNVYANPNDSAADKVETPQDNHMELLQHDDLLRSIVRKIKAGPSAGAAKPAQRAKPGRTELDVDMKWLLVPFSDLVLQKLVGSGSFGRVYLASWQHTVVAVKLLVGHDVDLTNLNAAAEQVLSESNPVLANLHKEASMMAVLNHPNVVRLMGICTSPPCIVSEYCVWGSLFDVLSEARSSPWTAQKLDWITRLVMAVDGAKGMSYLHGFRPALIHRDLRSPNLLVDGGWRVKVADFNLSRIMDEGSTACITSSARGGPDNPRWLAPEVLAGQVHTFASDVFSYGIVLWELLTWTPPWAGYADYQVRPAVMRGMRPDIPPTEQLPGGDFAGLTAYLDLLGRCWAQDPSARPTFDTIVKELRKLLSVAEREARLAAQGTPGGDVPAGEGAVNE